MTVSHSTVTATIDAPFGRVKIAERSMIQICCRPECAGSLGGSSSTLPSR